MSDIPAGLCQCGCGVATSIATDNYASRGYVKGQPVPFVLGHNKRSGKGKSYSYRGGRSRTRGGAKREHVIVAERALGRPLPVGTHVHHVDGNKRNNANSNLVICQDGSYHRLLHSRAKVVHAGGNPNTHHWCHQCKTPKPFSDFYMRHGLGRLRSDCKACVKVKNSQRSIHGED